jgi:uncharacterized protein (DUF3084 family)
VDLVTIGFLALIALVSGGIAYFADWLGRKLGKKRLRLGRLRPRHTAALGVVSSGILISLFTIGLVYALSSDVRQWIREGPAAIRDLTAARIQRDAANSESKELNKLNQVLRADNAQRQAEIDRARTTLKVLDANTRDLQSQIRANRVAARKLQAELDSVQAEYLSSAAKLQITEAQRKQVAASLAGIQKQYAALKGTFHGLTERYAELSAQSKDIQDYNTKVIRDNISLTASNDDLEKKGKALKAENQEVADSLEQLRGEYDKQTRDMEDQATRIRVDSEYLSRLDALVDSSRTHRMTFAAHEELARSYLPAHVTAAAATDAITSLLREARAVAESRGAKGVGPEHPSAAIFPREDPKTREKIPASEIVESMARRMSGRPTDQVLVATSTYNAFEGEQVSIDLAAYPNPLVYKRGQVLAETRIDGTDSEAEILSHITDLLKQKVRARAKSDHMIPAGDNSFGNVDGPEVYKIAKIVQSADRTVRLQAVARNDIRAGDPLEIELRIR